MYIIYTLYYYILSNNNSVHSPCAQSVCMSMKNNNKPIPCGLSKIKINRKISSKFDLERKYKYTHACVYIHYMY